MKIQVRRGLFETNSSSVHSLTMVSGDEYEKWKNGEMVYDRYNDELIPATDEKYIAWKAEYDKVMEEDGYYDDDIEYLTYDEFWDGDGLDYYETFSDTYTFPDGKCVIAFGYYGNNW